MNGKRNILFVDKDAYPSLEEPELFDTLAAGAGSIRVERIVSNGQVTPEGEWYDQDLDEWVVVLEGEARLHYMDGEEVGLKKGDSLFLPKRRKHRVVYTSSPCIWLAIHADLLTPQSVVADAILGRRRAVGFPRAEEGILHTEGFLFLRRALGMKKGFAVKQTLKTQVVGMARFERAVSASRTQRSTRLSHIP